MKYQLFGRSAASCAVLRLLLIGILLVPASAAGSTGVRRLSSAVEVEVAGDEDIPKVAKEKMKEMQNLTLPEALELPENKRVIGSPENENGVHALPCNP